MNPLRTAAVVVLLALLAMHTYAQAAGASGNSVASSTAPSPRTHSFRGGSYCGVNCLYTIMRLEGVRTELDSLLLPKYIGDANGSSPGELAQAARDHGMNAAIWQNLSARELFMTGQPVILHVKSDLSSTKYDHFILCLGNDGKSFRIFDPPEAVQMVSPHQLAKIWDGVAVAASQKPIPAWPLFLLSTAKSLMWVLGAGAAIIMTGTLVRRGRLAARPMVVRTLLAECLSLCMVAAVGAIIFHHCDTIGLLQHSDDIASIQNAYAMAFAPKLSIGDVEHHLQDGTVIVDARMPEDYVDGHIEGAVNIPVVRARGAVPLAITNRIPKDANIILYCQSNGCPFSDSVGRWLWQNGYKNLSVFRGGWVQWEARHPKSVTATSN